MTATHALRDKWFVSFLPLLVPDVVVSQFKGDWNLAAQKHMQRLDWVTSVEELWSTVNSLPKIHQLGVGSTYIFSRSDKDPSYETFPNGARVVLSLFRSPATELGVETVLATVLGESISREATDDKAVCDVIRISARPSREHNDTLRVEVWLNDQSYASAVAAALKRALQRRDVGPTLFSITDSPFEPIKSPVTPAPASKGAARPTSPTNAVGDSEQADEATAVASSTATKTQTADKDTATESEQPTGAVTTDSTAAEASPAAPDKEGSALDTAVEDTARHEGSADRGADGDTEEAHAGEDAADEEAKVVEVTKE